MVIRGDVAQEDAECCTERCPMMQREPTNPAGGTEAPRAEGRRWPAYAEDMDVPAARQGGP